MDECNCVAIWYSKKEQIESFYFPKGKKNWHILQIAKAHFSCPGFGSWFLKKVSQGARNFSLWGNPAPKVSTKYTKNCVSALKLPSCGLVVFIGMNMYTLTKGRNFKTFLRENYAVARGSCYLFTKKTLLNMELNIILIVLMVFANIKHSWNLQQILLIPCSLSRWWIWQSVSL